MPEDLVLIHEDIDNMAVVEVSTDTLTLILACASNALRIVALVFSK